MNVIIECIWMWFIKNQLWRVILLRVSFLNSFYLIQICSMFKVVSYFFVLITLFLNIFYLIQTFLKHFLKMYIFVALLEKKDSCGEDLMKMLSLSLSLFLYLSLSKSLLTGCPAYPPPPPISGPIFFDFLRANLKLAWGRVKRLGATPQSHILLQWIRPRSDFKCEGGLDQGSCSIVIKNLLMCCEVNAKCIVGNRKIDNKVFFPAHWELRIYCTLVRLRMLYIEQTKSKPPKTQLFLRSMGKIPIVENLYLKIELDKKHHLFKC